MINNLRTIAFLFFTFFFSTNINFAQTPNLGMAANFILFSSNGAVTNTGISQLTGNVGTNNGASTGFGNVNGVMHTADGATATAAANLLTAYNQINSTVPTASHAPLLGNGDTMNKGVYAIAGPASLNGKLVLNAKGNANAVFIFKISGAFSSAAASQIILINGAVACNVFWKVEGLISLASATKMRGTLIANNGGINMSTGVTLEGRALSTTGAISLNGITGKTPIGCGSTVLSGPAAPALGTTVCYAIFSGNGDVTNSGITNVTGDIGTNVGLTTGYNPLFVNGNIHSIPDGSTSACAADLLNIYSYLNTLAADIELLYPAQFGRSLVLTPHTYQMSAATTFNDTLFLNAEGNSNAVFVIKINGALSTSTYATVTLINGAQAKNVYWKVDGAVTINNYANMKGTIVCNNGAIKLKTGTVLYGRALTTNGALSTTASQVTLTQGCGSILPITNLGFKGAKMVNINVLEWSTATEINNSGFAIERGADGIGFAKIADVHTKAEYGNSSTKLTYYYYDEKPLAGNNYYRLKQTDIDGKFSYSAVVLLKGNNVNTLTIGSIYPNPARRNVNIILRSPSVTKVNLIITDITGKVVMQTAAQLLTGDNTITIPVNNLSLGTYIIKTDCTIGCETIVHKFVKE